MIPFLRERRAAWFGRLQTWADLVAAWRGTDHGITALVWLARYGTLLGSALFIFGDTPSPAVRPVALASLFLYFYSLVGFAVLGLHRLEWMLQRRMKYFQSAVDILFLSVFLCLDGGFRSPIVLFYFAPIAIMATLFSEADMLKVSLAISAAYILAATACGGSIGLHDLPDLVVRLGAMFVPSFVVWLRGGQALPGWEGGSHALQSMLAQLPYGSYIVDSQQKLLFVNPALQAKHGEYYKGKLCHQHLCGDSEMCSWCPVFNDFVGSTEPRRAILVDRRGRRYPAEISHHYPPGGAWAIGFVHDLTAERAGGHPILPRFVEAQRLVSELADALATQIGERREAQKEPAFARRAIEVVHAHLGRGPVDLHLARPDSATGRTILTRFGPDEWGADSGPRQFTADTHWPAAEAYREGQIVQVDDLQAYLAAGPQPTSPGARISGPARPVTCIPILLEGQVAGVASVYGPLRHGVTPNRILEVQALLNVLAMHLGDTAAASRALIDQPIMRRRWLDTLAELSAQLVTTEDPLALMDFCVERMRVLLNAETAAIFTLKDGRLWRRRASGVPNDWLADEHYVVGHNLTGRVIKPTGRSGRFGSPVRDNNVGGPNSSVNADYLQQYRRQLPSGQVRHLLAVPLNGRQGTFGVLRVVNRMASRTTLDPAGFDKEAEDYLMTLAAMVGVTLELVNQIQHEQQQRQLFDRLGEPAEDRLATIADRALEGLFGLVPFDAASLQMRRENSLEIVAVRELPRDLLGLHFSLDPVECPNAWVAANRQPLILSDAPHDFPHFANPRYSVTHIHGWLGAPVIYNDQVIAVITLDSVKPGVYTVDDAANLANYCRTIAPLIWSAQWFNASDDEIRFLSAILKVTASALTATDEGKLLDLASGIIRDTFRCDALAIALLDERGDLVVRRLVDGAGRSAGPEVSADVRLLLQTHLIEGRETLNLEVAADSAAFVPRPPSQADALARYSLLAAPICLQQGVAGAIALWANQPAVYEAADQRHLELLCNQIGAAYGSSLLIAEKEKSLRAKTITLQRYESLEQISQRLSRMDDPDQVAIEAARYGRAIMKVEDCSVFIVRRGPAGEEAVMRASSTIPRSLWGNHASPVEDAPHVGLTGWAIKSGQRLSLAGSEIASHPRHSGAYTGHLQYLPSRASHSLLIVPIHGPDHQHIGALKFENRTDHPGERFDNIRESFAEAFAAVVGLAIDRALLRAQMDRILFGLHHYAGVVQSRVSSIADLVLQDPRWRPAPRSLTRDLKEIRAKGIYVHAGLWSLMQDIEDPAVLQQGLQAALQQFAADQTSTIRLLTGSMASQIRLPLRVEQALYDIGREAIINADRHGGGSHSRKLDVEVSLTIHGPAYAFAVSNTGAPCPPGNLTAPNAIGIGLMQRLARRIRAECTIIPQARGGVIVTVHGTLGPAEEEAGDGRF